ncbi:MAG: Gfo/Idh/MocA family oxidoreductase, partial [Gemmataceae bacterium]|nr:Gfo/Idh/MocA family oxidoreductase [Gemmataceae bacterium]
AVSDVWDAALAEGKMLADPKAAAEKDFRKLLARKDIDAVLIGSPDHWHVPMTIAAVEAGKHVYVEKPLTHDLAEGEKVLKAVEGKKLAVQVGTQQRSMPHLIEARKLVQDGKLGKVLKTRMSWNRNAGRASRFKEKIDPKSVDWKAFLGSAKDQPFDSYRMRQWRWFWDFGGGLFTDLMVHWIDVAHWCLGLSAPTKAVSVGTHVSAKGVWETPDTVQTLLTYEGGVQAHFEGTFSNARAGAMIEFMGTDATLYADRGRYEVVPEGGRGKAAELVLGTGPKGRDFYDKPDGEKLHLEDWLAAIKEGREPSAPVAAGVGAAAAAHLANKALRGTGVAERDAH